LCGSIEGDDAMSEHETGAAGAGFRPSLRGPGAAGCWPQRRCWLPRPAGALAQAYPVKPLRMLVGAPPGGTTDIVARVIAQKLGERLGQTVVVENRAGAGGNIGMDGVAKAAPDGYTFGMAYSGLSINPSVMTAMPFDTLRDLAPVSLVAIAPMFLIVDPATQITSVKELVDRAKANPGSWRSPRVRLRRCRTCPPSFKQRAGIDMTTVCLQGQRPGVGRRDGWARCGDVRYGRRVSSQCQERQDAAIAVGGSKRMAWAGSPDPDRVRAAGFRDPVVVRRHRPGVTPPEIIERLAGNRRHRQDGRVAREPLSAQMLDPVGGSPAEFGAFIRAEMQLWEPVAKSAKIKME
jgi:tripartite-type tricarboxylate transporter receptor subunit TctC